MSLDLPVAPRLPQRRFYRLSLSPETYGEALEVRQAAFQSILHPLTEIFGSFSLTILLKRCASR